MRQPLFVLVVLLIACHGVAAASGEDDNGKVFRRRRRRTIKGSSSSTYNAKARGTKKQKGWLMKNFKRNRNKAKNAMSSTTTTTGAATSAPDRCNPECPCCDSTKWPEFVDVIESGGASCYSQNDPKESNLAAAIQCNPSYQVAYMSYSYSGMFKGGRFCGDSGTARQFLDATEALACMDVVDAAIGATSCSATFGECT